MTCVYTFMPRNFNIYDSQIRVDPEHDPCAQVPNMVVMAPSDEAELIHMVATAANHDSGPICFRFPRGNGSGLDLAAEGIIGFKGIPMEVAMLLCP